MKATLKPNGDGSFALSTGRMHLGRVALQPMQATVTGFEHAADGSWSVTWDDVQPVFETAPTAKPSPVYVEILRQHVQAAVDAGLCTLPEGMTVEEVVAQVEWAPIGRASLFGEGDVERIESHERGWPVQLGA